MTTTQMGGPLRGAAIIQLLRISGAIKYQGEGPLKLGILEMVRQPSPEKKKKIRNEGSGDLTTRGENLVNRTSLCQQPTTKSYKNNRTVDGTEATECDVNIKKRGQVTKDRDRPGNTQIDLRSYAETQKLDMERRGSDYHFKCKVMNGL